MITWKRVSLTYKFREDVVFPPFLGSALRGGFGTIFKREVCIQKDKECERCILRERCPYLYIFETPIPKDTEIMRKYTKAPHPFVIDFLPHTDTAISKGEVLSFDLILIGKAIEYLPYFIYTFIRLGQKGLGKNRAKASLISVKDGEREIFDPHTKTLGNISAPSSLEFTPYIQIKEKYEVKLSFPIFLNIRKDGKIVRDLDFNIFIRSLFRRLGLLEYFHNDGSREYPFTPLLKYVDKIDVKDKNLKYKRTYRYSSRQKKRIPLEGLIGYIVFSNVPDIFLPYIEAASDLHVGRNTSFGFGKVVVEYKK